MNAGVYDVNGQPTLHPRNVMSDLNAVANQLQEGKTMPMRRNSNYSFTNNSQNKSVDMRLLPANERAVQESQLAVEREMLKQRRLQEFQKKTKLAAKSYGKVIKSETYLIQEQAKIDIEEKTRKKKEFEDKLKKMRQNMRVKPKNSEPKSSKNEKSNKNTIAVKVQSNPSTTNKGQNKENEGVNKKIYNNSILKRNFGSTSI